MSASSCYLSPHMTTSDLILTVSGGTLISKQNLLEKGIFQNHCLTKVDLNKGWVQKRKQTSLA